MVIGKWKRNQEYKCQPTLSVIIFLYILDFFFIFLLPSLWFSDSIALFRAVAFTA